MVAFAVGAADDGARLRVVTCRDVGAPLYSSTASRTDAGEIPLVLNLFTSVLLKRGSLYSLGPISPLGYAASTAATPFGDRVPSGFTAPTGFNCRNPGDVIPRRSDLTEWAYS